MASIEQIQALLVKENVKLKEALGKEIMQQVGPLIDKRLEAHEEKIMKEIHALQARADALEKHPPGDARPASGPAAAKRARSEPRTASQKHELKPVVVLTGFPFNSRKQELEGFVKEKLAEQEEWSHLSPFAPGVRASVVIVKVTSKEEVFEFIRFWKDLGFTFKDRPIRARTDKTPEQRKTNSMIYKMSEHLKGALADKGVDPDFKNSSVWVGRGEVVKWDPQAGQFGWLEAGIATAEVTIDRTAAEKCADLI